MSTPTTTEVQQPEKPKTLGKVGRILSLVVGLILMATGLLQVYHVFYPALPGCASNDADLGLRNIFKQKNVELTSISDKKTLTDTSSEETCQASFVTPSEAGTLLYRIYWEGKVAQIQITKVDTHPR